MRGTFFAIIFIFLAFGQSIHVTASNDESLTEDQAKGLLQKTFHVQVSLTEKERSLEEIRNILTPVLTKSLIERYMDEVVMEGEEQYIVFATDAPIVTIPFFNYEKPFEYVRHGHKRMIYQFFPGTNEGPVSYEDHFEGVTFKEENGIWKVHNIFSSEKEPIFEEIKSQLEWNGSNEENNQSVQNEKVGEHVRKTTAAQSLQAFPFVPAYLSVKTFLSTF